jgi:hypothetical protein
MKAQRSRPLILKSELLPAFLAAREAGYEQVSIVVDLIDGRRFEITARQNDSPSTSETTPLKKWQSDHAQG